MSIHKHLPFTSPPPSPHPLSPPIKVCAGGLVPAGATGALPPGSLSSAHTSKHPHPKLRKLSQVVDVAAKDGSSPLIIAAMGGHIEVDAMTMTTTTITTTTTTTTHHHKKHYRSRHSYPFLTPTLLTLTLLPIPFQVVAYLLTIGASINLRNKAGWTALIAAAATGQVRPWLLDTPEYSFSPYLTVPSTISNHLPLIIICCLQMPSLSVVFFRWKWSCICSTRELTYTVWMCAKRPLYTRPRSWGDGGWCGCWIDGWTRTWRRSTHPTAS